MDLAQRASRLIFPPMSALASCEIDMSFLSPPQAKLDEHTEDQEVAERLKEKLAKSKNNLILKQTLAAVQKRAVMRKPSSLRAFDYREPIVNLLDGLAARFPPDLTPEVEVQVNKRIAEELLAEIVQDALDRVKNFDTPLLLAKTSARLATLKKNPYMSIRGLQRRVWNRFVFSKSLQLMTPKKGLLKLPGLWRLYHASWLEVVTHGCRTDRVVVRKVGLWSNKIERLRRIERKMFSASFQRKVQRVAKFHLYFALLDLSTFAGATSTVWQSALWKLLLHQLSTLPYVMSRAAWEEQGAFCAYLDVVQAHLSKEGMEKSAEGRSSGVHEQLKAAVEKAEKRLSGPIVPSRELRELTGVIEEASTVRARLDKEGEALERACRMAEANLKHLVQKRTSKFDKMWQEYLEKPGDFEFDLPVADLYTWIEMKEFYEAEETALFKAGKGTRMRRRLLEDQLNPK